MGKKLVGGMVVVGLVMLNALSWHIWQNQKVLIMQRQEEAAVAQLNQMHVFMTRLLVEQISDMLRQAQQEKPQPVMELILPATF